MNDVPRGESVVLVMRNSNSSFKVLSATLDCSAGRAYRQSRTNSYYSVKSCLT